MASAASSLAVVLLQPVMARLLFPASDLGLLSYVLPPLMSPVFIRSRFLAFALNDLALEFIGKDATESAARPKPETKLLRENAVSTIG